jgi:hypothetical protein
MPKAADPLPAGLGHVGSAPILLKNSQNAASSGIFIPNIVGTLDQAFNI